MKNVMKRAWEIAKEGAKKFGGKAVEYIAMALKMAWSETRKAVLTTAAGSRKHKSWVAKIVGKHPRFKFDRCFVDSVDYNMSERYFELKDGFYDVCDAGTRYFVRVIGGQIERVEEYEVAEAVA